MICVPVTCAFATIDAAGRAQAMDKESPRLDEHTAEHVADDVTRTVTKVLDAVARERISIFIPLYRVGKAAILHP